MARKSRPDSGTATIPAAGRLTFDQKCELAAARYLDCYWDIPVTEREQFMQALEQRAAMWRAGWTGRKPGRLSAVTFVDRPADDDPRRNLRPVLKVIRQ